MWLFYDIAFGLRLVNIGVIQMKHFASYVFFLLLGSQNTHDTVCTAAKLGCSDCVLSKLVLIEYHRVMGSRSNRQIIAEDGCNSDATRSLHPSYHHISMSLSWPGNTNLERSWETFPASCKHPHTPPPCPCCHTKDEIRRCWLLSAIIRTQIGIMLTSQTKISSRFNRRVNAQILSLNHFLLNMGHV